MHADDRVNLTAVFGPEHGFRGTAQAGGSEGRYDDPATGLPVYDTYLKSGQPLADIFTASGVDTVVFDIQDVGARFYTYIWTLYDCMEAAAARGQAVRGAGPAEPGDRAGGPGARAAQGVRDVRRAAADRPGARDDGGGAGAAVQRGVPGRAGGAGRRTDVGVAAVGLLRRVRAAVGAAEPEHADARHRAGVLGDVSLRGDEPVGGARYDPAVRTARRRGDRPAVGRRGERDSGCPGCTSGRRTSRRPSPSSRGRPSVACRSTCTTGRPTTRCAPGSRCW